MKEAQLVQLIKKNITLLHWMRIETTTVQGFPDLIGIAPQVDTIFVECKRLPLVEDASFCMKDPDPFISQRTGRTTRRPRSVGTRSVRTCARRTVHEPTNIAKATKYSHVYTWEQPHGSRATARGARTV